MPRDFSRTERINNLLQRELAAVITREVKDPRMPQFVSVSEVVVSRDLSHAKIYISLLEDQNAEVVIEILNRAAGYLRSVLAQRVKLRVIPQLNFFHDTSMQYGNRMSEIIDKLVNPEEQEKDE